MATGHNKQEKKCVEEVQTSLLPGMSHTSYEGKRNAKFASK